MAAIVGFDIHSEPGIIKVNQKLTKESGSVVVDFIKKMLPCSDGNTYGFGDTGKIYKRTSGGTWTLEATAAPAAGTAGIRDAFEDQGYIYYTMELRIGRVAVGAPTNWAGRNDSWATFTNGDALFHPVAKVNLVNYIGDKNFVAQIEDGIFTAEALDIKNPLRVRSLGIFDTELLLGTYVNDNINATEIFRWNTWSVSFTNSDPISEKGINAFLKMDNEVLVNAGEKGNLYIYDGSKLRKGKRIPGNWGIGKKAIVHQDAAADFNIPIFGFSNVSGNPCLLGVYGYGSYSSDYSPVLTLEYVPSHGKVIDVEIGSITIVDDYILVSWKDGSTYGVDKLDSTAKYGSAYMETRIMFPDRKSQNRFTQVRVPYRLLPTGTDLQIWKSVNYGAYEQITGNDIVNDSERKFIQTTVAIDEVIALQIKVVAVVNGNDAPEFEGIDTDVQD